MKVDDVLFVRQGLVQQASGVHTIGGQGNSLVVDLGDQLLLVDTGPGGAVTRGMIERVYAAFDKRVGYIVYSHGHMGYNNGVADWLAQAQVRGDAPPCVVAHARLPQRYERYRETAGLQSYSNTRQFRAPYPAQVPPHWFHMPDRTYDDVLEISGRDRSVTLLWAPSETDDGTAVWVPDVRALYGSNAFIKVCPNAGTPYRILRDPIRWARTLESFLALKPQVLIPEFGKPLTDPAEIHEALTVPAQAMRYLRAEVVRRMNQGMSEVDILHDVPLPAALFEHRFMKPGYGCAEYIMRDIWRSESGWWNRNPTDLHPARPADAARAVLQAIADPQRVLDEATRLQQAGETQLALHVIDLLALAPTPDDPFVRRARELKIALCDERATQVSSGVSANLYRSSADDLRGVPPGSTDPHYKPDVWA